MTDTTDQWDRAGNKEIYPLKYGQLIFDIDIQIIHLQIVFSTNDGRTIGHPYAKKMNQGHMGDPAG